MRLPDRADVLPPGGYLLQVEDGDGVPHSSQTVTITAGRLTGSVTVAGSEH